MKTFYFIQSKSTFPSLKIMSALREDKNEIAISSDKRWKKERNFEKVSNFKFRYDYEKTEISYGP